MRTEFSVPVSIPGSDRPHHLANKGLVSKGPDSKIQNIYIHINYTISMYHRNIPYGINMGIDNVVCTDRGSNTKKKE